MAEVRPYAGHPDVLVLVARTTDWSFPSDHSVMAGAAAAGLLMLSRYQTRVRPLALVGAAAAILMAATRVYVGVHYPLDVIAGLAFGAAASVLGWVLVRPPLSTLVEHARARQRLPRSFQPARSLQPDLQEE